MGHGTTGDGPISGYSTQAGTNGGTDGYHVVINPDNLAAAMAEVAQEVRGKSDISLTSLLLQNTVGAVTWGQIPLAPY